MSEREMEVPSGWVLVPEKPTEQMLEAACFYEIESGADIEGIYHFMIGAAPKLPAPSSEGGEKPVASWVKPEDVAKMTAALESYRGAEWWFETENPEPGKGCLAPLVLQNMKLGFEAGTLQPTMQQFKNLVTTAIYYQLKARDLSQPEQQGGGAVGETVAWRYKSGVGERDSFWLTTVDPRLARIEAENGNIVEPLYTHPPLTPVSDPKDLEAELREAREALHLLLDRDCVYRGAEICITANSHGDAIHRVSRARTLLARLDKKGDEE